MNTKLEGVYSQIPKATCVPGCGKCCGPVFPSRAELRDVHAWCMRHHLEYKDFLDITIDGSCPYLSPEMQCLIYPVRPFLCRLLGVSVDTPCPVGLCEAKKILTHSQSDALYGAIYLHGKEKHRTRKHQKIVREVLAKL